MSRDPRAEEEAAFWRAHAAHGVATYNDPALDGEHRHDCRKCGVSVLCAFDPCGGPTHEELDASGGPAEVPA